MRLLINGVIGGLTILYPIAVYFGIQYLKPWEIAIHDADGMHFPNLALMKLSAYHKSIFKNWGKYESEMARPC